MAGADASSKVEEGGILGLELTVSEPELLESQVFKTCILVLGMHRSGTSALTGVLNKLGCELPARPIPASKSNPKGFFESVAVRDFNDELLASAGSSWDDFTQFHEHWLQCPEAPSFLDRASTLLQQEFGDARLFVLKDPRICRLVPFWTAALERFGCVVRPVLTVRNPLEVGHSLLTKRNFNEPLSQMLWLRHALDAESATRGRMRFHTSFEELMQGWEMVAEKAQESLRLVWPKPLPNVEFDVASFLSGELRHHAEPAARAVNSELLPVWIRETYDVLSSWAKQGENVSDHSMLDRIKTEFDVASSAFARLVRAERESSAGQRERALLSEGTIKALEAKLEDLTVVMNERRVVFETSLEEQRASSQAERNALEAQLQEQQVASHAERESFQVRIAALIAEADQQRATFEQSIEEDRAAASALHDALTARLAGVTAKAENEIDELKKELQEQRRQTTLLNGELHQLKESSEGLEAELAASRVRRKEAARVIARRDADLQARFEELAALQRYILHSSLSWRSKQLIGRAKRLLRRAIDAKAGRAAKSSF
jgi:hypothetical protein